MKVLYLLLLIPLCLGLPQCTSPMDVQVITNGDEQNLWLDINWSKVKNDDKDPVLGYKVKLFVVEPKVSYEYHENIDGKLQASPKYEIPVKLFVVEPKVSYEYHENIDGKLQASPKYEIPNFNVNEETGELKTELDIPANKTDATIKGLKIGVTYEVGVHAYSKNCEGALTKKMRIKLDPPKKN